MMLNNLGHTSKEAYRGRRAAACLALVFLTFYVTSVASREHARLTTLNGWPRGLAAPNDADLARKSLQHGAPFQACAWAVVSSPNPVPNNNHLYGVTAVSPNDVWAVGESLFLDLETLTMHWDGSVWSLAGWPANRT
jgi:hypothetical protein